MPSGTANLNRDSLVLAHQTTTMDRSKLTARVGSLPELTLCAAERALLHALAIK
ncbi:MAG: type II toxin-antitoxin system PemK/MazF family toxin [Candidatus Eremiobacteraeota bacterium]|nr:type II toxin-antitoxin system PemK/MazF family toxin [Candidatus Eremiobacteraeota bacterium]MCW5869655.1 type II toxin-antitoxin system PemK/MazF family toxin [Candidatus Eremiobacteraeota bacterium]